MKRTELIKKRLALGLTQRGMAKRAGLSDTVIGNLEKGLFPRPSSIPKLARAYEFSNTEFVNLLYER